MKPSVNIDEYFYKSSILNLKITASPEAVVSIDFIKSGKPGSRNVPRNVSELFFWLDIYSERKTDPSYRITFWNGIKRTPGLPAGEKEIVLDISGYTENEHRVYRELMKVQAGMTISYGLLAAKSDIPKGGRFAGNVMAKNRFPVIIPCHRVIKSDGSMGNYSGGVEIKRMLLLHETGGFSPARDKGQEIPVQG